jgi:predicted RNA binding protein YcfA (HicA-like mRNA interferase family)
MLRRYGYEQTRQTGSHLRLTSTARGAEHHVTIPSHDALKIGTLSAILHDVAAYLEMDHTVLAAELFGG